MKKGIQSKHSLHERPLIRIRVLLVRYLPGFVAREQFAVWPDYPRKHDQLGLLSPSI